MDRQKIIVSRYIAAFAISTLVFAIGIMIGNYLNSEKISKLHDIEGEIRVDTLGTEIQYALLSDNPCSAVDYSELSYELFQIGTRLDFMEKQMGKKDKDVLNLKEYYSLLEIRHWLFLKKAKEDCGFNSNWVIYFYSNQEDCERCSEEGQILNYVHDRYNGTNIYSFDYNIENPAIKTLKFLYNVTTVPTTIINGVAFSGFKSLDEIKSELDQKILT